jgi:hydroxyethylthiazole kinase-like uncharacterized protein yjeF
MKLFTADKIRELDQYTIQHEPVASIDLMERAAGALLETILSMYPAIGTQFCIFAGPGNNGGDALALARNMQLLSYEVQVHLFDADNLSVDCATNKNRLIQQYPDLLTEHKHTFVKPVIGEKAVIIDGLFGSGLNRPLTGIYAHVIDFINSNKNTVIAIDIPSGLYADGCHQGIAPVVRADYTLSFQFPKLAFFFRENEDFVGDWSILDIGLHPKGIEDADTDYHYLEQSDIVQMLHKRKRFAHKGTYGHLALIAGSEGMAGAAILAAKSAIKTGLGLLTIHGPECNRIIAQTAVPESIYSSYPQHEFITAFTDKNRYNAFAIGPGLGTGNLSLQVLNGLLENFNKPGVFDADALNIISAHKEMLSKLPRNSILTPHPKEFERLLDESVQDSLAVLDVAREMARKYHLIIVLKGAYTRIVCPDGKVYFNGTGNPGMATGGAGDVLTGMIGSLLAQGYEPETAAILGVFLHGLAADIALESESEESLSAGDIVNHLGRAFKQIAEKQ